ASRRASARPGPHRLARDGGRNADRTGCLALALQPRAAASGTRYERPDARAGLLRRSARQARTSRGDWSTAHRRLNPTIPQGAAAVRCIPSLYRILVVPLSIIRSVHAHSLREFEGLPSRSTALAFIFL